MLECANCGGEMDKITVETIKL